MKIIINNNGEDWYDVLSLVWSYLETTTADPPSSGEIVSDGNRTFFVRPTKLGLSFVFGIVYPDDDSTETETVKYPNEDV